MLGLKIDANESKQYAFLALAYLIIALVMFWPIALNIASTVPGTGGDTFQSMWDLWWVPYAVFTLHATPYLTHYVFYPVGANLATQTLAPIAGLVSALFQYVSLPFAFNVIFLLGFALSGLFTYMLAFRFTKHRAASFIAGLIYAFSPIHTIQAFGHLQFTNIEFIPLFLLLLLKMTEEKKGVYALGAALSFVLTAFMGDIEQGLMTALLALFVLAYLFLVKGHRHKLLDKKFPVLFFEMLAAAFLIGSPFILSILTALSPGTLASVNAQATTQFNELYSPDLLSFFVPSQFNGVLGFLSSGFAGVMSRAAAEKTTYVGYSVLLLVAVALVHEYRDRFKNTGVLLVPLVLFALLSIGPYLQINGNVTAVPGLYLLYHQLPLFNVLREPGRFDIPLELLLAVFAAIGIVKLESRYASSNLKRYIPAIFLVLLIIEYNSWPISKGMLAGMYTLNTAIPKPFYEIGQLNGNFSVLVLPALPNFTSTKPNQYPGLALYYQTAFKHPLVGGYTTRINATQMFSLANVPLIVAAYYLQTGQGLVYGSPIQENYSSATAFLLGAYNVGFVALTRSAYNQSELQQAASYLVSFLGYPVYQGNDSIVFQTSKLVNTSGTVRAAYTPVIFNNPNSVWQPGWVLCGSSVVCGRDYVSTYFGSNPAYINIYSPNYTKVSINFRALSPTGPKASYVYFNNQLLATINLTPALQNFSIKTGLSLGINNIVFVSANNSQGSYSNIGIANLTIKK